MKRKDIEEFMDNREKRIAFAFMALDQHNSKSIDQSVGCDYAFFGIFFFVLIFTILFLVL